MNEQTRKAINLISALMVISMSVLVLSCTGGGSSIDTGTPTEAVTPTPSLGPVSGRIAFISSDANLALINGDGSGEQAITNGGGVTYFAWSPNGMLIAATTAGADAESVRVLRPDGSAVFDLTGSSPLWSPDSLLVVVQDGSGLVIVDTAGAEILRVSDAIQPAWAPNSGQLVALRTDANGKAVPIVVSVPAGGESLLDAEIQPDDSVYPLTWHPDGNGVAYRDAIYEVGTGRKIAVAGIPVYFSPNGRLVLVVLPQDATQSGRPAQLWDLSQGLKPIIGLEIRPAVDSTPPQLFIQRWTEWLDAGRILVYADPDAFRPRIRVYETVAQQQQTYQNIRGEYLDASPDGKYLTFTHNSRIWVFPVEGYALVDIAAGSLSAWQPSTP